MRSSDDEVDGPPPSTFDETLPLDDTAKRKVCETPERPATRCRRPAAQAAEYIDCGSPIDLMPSSCDTTPRISSTSAIIVGEQTQPSIADRSRSPTFVSSASLFPPHRPNAARDDVVQRLPSPSNRRAVLADVLSTNELLTFAPLSVTLSNSFLHSRTDEERGEEGTSVSLLPAVVSNTRPIEPHVSPSASDDGSVVPSAEDPLNPPPSTAALRRKTGSLTGSQNSLTSSPTRAPHHHASGVSADAEFPVRAVIGKLRRYDDDLADGAADNLHQNRRSRAMHSSSHAAADATAFPMTLRPPLQKPSAHAASENWSMIRRFGFPCSDNALVCDADLTAFRQHEGLGSTCDQQWASALRGVPLLANATDVTNAPLRHLCRKCGIPGHLRSLVWLTLSGAALKMEENESLCSRLVDMYGSFCDEQVCDAIEKDLDRTFPSHPYYAEGDVGQVKLRRVLHALCWRNPLLNYCQSFNFLAATFLLIVEDEEAAFWLMNFLLENLLPNDYYGEGLLGVKVDQEVVLHLVEQELPRLAHHFDEYRFDVRALVPAWLLTLFVNTFPFDTVVRIWDVMITHSASSESVSSSLGGVHSASNGGGRCTFPIAVLLAFLKLHQDGLLHLDDAGEMMQLLSASAALCFDRERLIKTALSLKLRSDKLHHLRRHHKTLVRQREASRAVERRAWIAKQSAMTGGTASTAVSHVDVLLDPAYEMMEMQQASVDDATAGDEQRESGE